MSNTHILISGCGSIGTRHAHNLCALGLNVTTCDPHAEADYKDFEEALKEEKPAVVFICSPTKLHIPQALAATKAGCHLFIEKPLSHTLDGIEELQKEVNDRELITMVGCNMRFAFGPSAVKKILDAGTIGKIMKSTVYTGSYLPDWRPQNDHKKSYSADPAQGGAILDCIHEIDIALWYAGPARLESVTKESAESIGIDVEGTADLTLQHESGATSDVHLSFIEPEYKRFCDIEGEKGSVRWDFSEKKVDVKDAEGNVTETIKEPEGYDINQMYMDEVEHFLACVEQKSIPEGNLEEARQTLEIALAAKSMTV